MIEITVSPGELFDRVTILLIKNERIGDPVKKHIVLKELEQMTPPMDMLWTTASKGGFGPRLEGEFHLLKQLNETLWVIEDELRLCETEQSFDDRFVQLARSVYKTNDRRAETKRRISEMFNAAVYEVKSYV